MNLVATVGGVDPEAVAFVRTLVEPARVTREVDGDSATLGDLLTNLDAGLLVIPPSRADELVTNAPCLVAVIPESWSPPETVRTVGLAWDGTLAAAHALRWAARLVSGTHAVLHLVHVLWAPEAEEEALEELERVRDHLTGNCRCVARVLDGDPVDALVAGCADLDLLVLGCGHPDGDSVAVQVAARAPTAVMVVAPDVDVPPLES